MWLQFGSVGLETIPKALAGESYACDSGERSEEVGRALKVKLSTGRLSR